MTLPFFRNTDDPARRAILGARAGAVGIACNLFLAAGKLTVGALAHSISITADGVNNLSDALSSLITALGFRLARKPADAAHPYGHARYEYLSALAVAGLILVVGVQLGKDSFLKILHPAPVDVTAVTLAVLLGSIAVKAWLWHFFTGLGRLLSSGVLTATAKDARNDCITTAALLVSFGVGKLWGRNPDGWAGALVSLFILISGFRLLRDTVSPLLGTRPDDALTKAITDLVTSDPGVQGGHGLLIHDYGPGKIFASIHAEVSEELSLTQAHEILDNLEKEAWEKLHVDLVIHCDPAGRDENS